MEVFITKRKVIIDDEVYAEHKDHLATTMSSGHPLVVWHEVGWKGKDWSHAKVFAQLLLGADFKSGDYVIPANSNWLDVTRENLRVVSRSYFNQFRRTTKYKGVLDGKTLRVNVYLDGVKKIVVSTGLTCTEENRKEAARLYDACCDFLGKDGYRNCPGNPASLTDGMKEWLKAKYTELMER